jgi:hypothetical protein
MSIHSMELPACWEDLERLASWEDASHLEGGIGHQAEGRVQAARHRQYTWL